MNCKCGNNLFKIDRIPCCDDCSENGAWDTNEQELTYDNKLISEKSLTRCQVDEDGECRFGYAYGAGCYIFICSKCGNIDNTGLCSYRVNGKREFFNLPLQEAIRFSIDAIKYAGTIETNLRLKRIEQALAGTPPVNYHTDVEPEEEPEEEEETEDGPDIAGHIEIEYSQGHEQQAQYYELRFKDPIEKKIFDTYKRLRELGERISRNKVAMIVFNCKRANGTMTKKVAETLNKHGVQI